MVEGAPTEDGMMQHLISVGGSLHMVTNQVRATRPRRQPRQSGGGGKFIENRLRSRFPRLKTSALRGTLAFGDPLLDSGVEGSVITCPRHSLVYARVEGKGRVEPLLTLSLPPTPTCVIECAYVWMCGWVAVANHGVFVCLWLTGVCVCVVANP